MFYQSRSQYYPAMIITKAFTDYLVSLGEGRVKPLPDDLLKLQVPLLLFQCLARTLLTQNSDGSWGSGNSKEDTAYAVMVLKATWALPFEVGMLRKLSDQALKRGKAFILSKLDAPFCDYNWIGKCSYGLVSVSRGVALSALSDVQTAREYAMEVKRMYDIPMDQIAKQVELFSQLPFLAETPTWIIEAAAIEGGFYLHELRKIDYLDQKEILGEDLSKLCSVLCGSINYRNRAFLSNRMLFGMVDLMTRVSHVDHFMNTELRGCSSDALARLESSILRLFPETSPEAGEYTESTITPEKKED